MQTASPASEATLQAPARLFAALADPARLRILNLIQSGGEVCNCHIEAVTGYLPSKISRHLAILRQVGLLQERREGTFIHYQLAPAANAVVRQTQRALDLLAEENPLLEADRDRLRTGCGRA